jgi:hypothetical protein
LCFFTGTNRPSVQTIALEVFVKNETSQQMKGMMASFIGCWTRILPLSLSDLKLHVPISETISDNPECIAAIKAYNIQLESTIQEDIKLTSGDPKSQSEDPAVFDLRGGVCRSGNDLRSMLIRFFCEVIMDCACKDLFRSDPKGWELSEKGYNVQCVVHRRLSCDSGPGEFYFDIESIKLFLTHSGTLLLPFITQTLSPMIQGNKSLSCILDHLVNRGHKSAPFVEGLTVELLPFQLQSLQWALERESVTGGIQSLFTAKIPRDDGDMYYNPITGKLSRTAPSLVRGGIIAEQMVSLSNVVVSIPGSHCCCRAWGKL